VLVALAEELGMPREGFLMAFADAMQDPGAHIRESRELLQQLGGSGFPTFALEKDGREEMLASAGYLRKPEAWLQMLEATVSARLLATSG
jgi:putative protein-disulfide isomerase